MLALLLETTTGVATVAGSLTSTSVTVACAACGVTMRPTDGAGTTKTPTGAATIAPSVPGGGAPTTTVICRTSLPARNVSVAVPATPVMIVTALPRSPIATLTGASTRATAGLLLVIVTFVTTVAGAFNNCTVIVRWPPGATMTRPTSGGASTCAPAIGLAIETVFETSGLTDATTAASPRAEVAVIVVFPNVVPPIGTVTSS